MAKHRSPPPDQKFRDQIATQLDRTMLVEAAAGTGKTTCLIDRMLGLLREEKCRIDSLAAVTFTRKAAAELRTRFQVALERAAAEATGRARENLAAALAHVERCFIGTIHSFCTRLLRERPVEAGVNPGFVELDEVEDGQLREQAWRDHVAELIATESPLLPELERLGLKVSASTRPASSLASELDVLGLTPADLGPAFLRFADFPDVEEWPAPPRPLPDLAPCIAALQKYVAHIRGLNLPADHGNDLLMPKYDQVVRRVQRSDLTRPAELMEVLEECRSVSRIVQKMWPGKKVQALAEEARWNAFCEDHAKPLLLAWREHRYEPVMRAIRLARDVYERLRRERNALNFHDLLLKAAALLRDKSAVRRYFRERFTHLLVDEFQDTDPIQAEVMLLLTADDCEERDWQKCRPVPGSLFVVGDPKQSIYRFRRADIVTYSKVRSMIEASGGEVAPLSANFRSLEPLVKWVNECFSGIFPARANDFSPADRPLEVGRREASEFEARAEALRVPAAATNKATVHAYESDLIARTIRQALDARLTVPRTEGEKALGFPEHAVPGDFMIVTRNKRALTEYARKLQEYGVPHNVTGGSLLNEVPELHLLCTCLSAITNIDDTIALVATLRSEVFGISDAALYEFRRLKGKFNFYADVPEGMPEEDAAALSDAFARLREYAGWLRHPSPAAAIERIAADLGLLPRACAAKEGDLLAGSLLKAIELLREAGKGFTVRECVDWLMQLVEKDAPYDGISVRPSALTPVRVMNLHQCKGLEAPFVFLADPSGATVHDVEVHIDRAEGVPRGYLPIRGPKRSEFGKPQVLAQPADWEDLAARERQFLDAELHRLLYVAATRAGLRLVVSQRAGRDNQSNPWQAFDRHLPAESIADPGPVSAAPGAPLTIDRAAWDGEVAAIERRWRTAMQPTYAVQAIKAAAIQAAGVPGGFKPHGAEEKGAEWGELLHTLLEAAIKRPAGNLQKLAASVAEGLELAPALADAAVASVLEVLKSEMWQRAQRAKLKLTEVPMWAMDESNGAGSAVPTVLRGVIDLAFREPAGWVIVDYKSERVDASKIPQLVEYYRPQLAAYARVWERIAGDQVAECGLFFTHTREYVQL